MYKLLDYTKIQNVNTYNALRSGAREWNLNQICFVEAVTE